MVSNNPISMALHRRSKADECGDTRLIGAVCAGPRQPDTERWCSPYSEALCGICLFMRDLYFREFRLPN